MSASVPCRELFVSSASRQPATAASAASPGLSLEAPLLGIEAARNLIRAWRRSLEWTGPVKVWLEAGTYSIRRPLRFDTRDTGPVTYAARNGEVVVDGGYRLESWKAQERNGRQLWVADVTEVLTHTCRPIHSLFVAGERRVPSRWPKHGFFCAERAFGSAERPRDGTHRVVLPEGLIPEHWSLQGADFRVLHKWMDERLPVSEYDVAERVLTCSRRSISRLVCEADSWRRERMYFENVLDALGDTPGEWALDAKARKIYYAPRPGEEIDSFVAVVPLVDQLLRLEGDVDPYLPVDGLRFENICFRYADWVQPFNDWGKRFDPFVPPDQWRDRASYLALWNERETPPTDVGCSPQAAFTVPGAISMIAARRCTLSGCRVEHVGYHAVDLADGCSEVTVEGCVVDDIGAGGVLLDGSIEPLSPLCTHDNRIEKNKIRRCGRVFFSGCGVASLHSYGNVIADNEISDLHYSGVSLGWEWGRGQHVSRDNIVERNHIHDIGGEDVLSDLAGVYVLGAQPGTIIRHNRIHDVRRDSYGGFGIYLDASCSNVTVEHNHIERIHDACVNFNIGATGNLLVGNRLVAKETPAVVVCRPPAVPVIDFGPAATFLGNFFSVSGAPVYVLESKEAPELSKVIRCEANYYWDPAAASAPETLVKLPKLVAEGEEAAAATASGQREASHQDFAQWQQQGQDRCGKLLPGEDQSVARKRG